MDPSFLNNPIFQSIPKEKQQFLQAFAARSHTGTEPMNWQASYPVPQWRQDPRD